MRIAFVLAVVVSCADPPTHRIGAPCECADDSTMCEIEGCGTCAGTCVVECVDSMDCPEGADCGVVTPGRCEFACSTVDDCPAWLDRCDRTCYGGEIVVAM